MFTVYFSSHASDNIILGCYKKNGGQLRIVNNVRNCLPSEVPIFWNQAGIPGSPGPAGPTGPQGPPGDASTAPGETSPITVRQMKTNQCTGVYGWCPDGFKWIFRILDSTVNGSSVVAINIVNPYLLDYGCEVATKGVGEFLIFCIGTDYVGKDAILQYAVFNP
jgi:hypothetical protein